MLPRGERKPLHAIAVRFSWALALVVFMTAIVWFDRHGYQDAAGGGISLLDALYYTTVSISTTGYGDIVPVTPEARLISSLVMTPARLLFILLLIGTTLSVLTERSREAIRIERWRKQLNNHVIVCGYGTKGRSVLKTLLAQGVEAKHIVVIERDEPNTREALASGIAVIGGDCTRTTVLDQAHVREAKSVVVAVDRDDAAVLTTLTARELNPGAQIVAAVREQENAHLLRQSGADSVITSSDASGHLLGMATASPHLVTVLEDLLTVGSGIEMFDRPVAPNEVGSQSSLNPEEQVIAVIRKGYVLNFAVAGPYQEDDTLVVVAPCKSE